MYSSEVSRVQIVINRHKSNVSTKEMLTHQSSQSSKLILFGWKCSKAKLSLDSFMVCILFASVCIKYFPMSIFLFYPNWVVFWLITTGNVTKEFVLKQILQSYENKTNVCYILGSGRKKHNCETGVVLFNFAFWATRFSSNHYYSIARTRYFLYRDMAR